MVIRPLAIADVFVSIVVDLVGVGLMLGLMFIGVVAAIWLIRTLWYVLASSPPPVDPWPEIFEPSVNSLAPVWPFAAGG